MKSERRSAFDRADDAQSICGAPPSVALLIREGAALEQDGVARRFAHVVQVAADLSRVLSAVRFISARSSHELAERAMAQRVRVASQWRRRGRGSSSALTLEAAVMLSNVRASKRLWSRRSALRSPSETACAVSASLIRVA